MLCSIISLNAKKKHWQGHKEWAASIPTQPMVTVGTNVQLPMPISGLCL